MAKLKLELEGEVTLRLLGIQSSWSEHRLVWAMNKQLGIRLQRDRDFTIETHAERIAGGLFDQEPTHYFSVFVYENEEEQAILVANLGQGMALYDKKRKLDYIFKMDSNRIEETECMRLLSEIRGVLAVTRIDCSADENVGRPFSDFI